MSSSHSDTALQSQAVPGPGEFLDDDMKQLIQLMQRARYENSTPISPACPPDFALGASFPKDHVMSALVKLQEEVIDFTAHLVEKNVLYCKEGSPTYSTLTNDIHPLFGIDKFKVCKPKIYEVLKPALRLASLLLTHRACSSYFLTMAFGKRELDPNTTSTEGIPLPRIKQDVEWSADLAERFEKTLLDSVRYVQVSFTGLEHECNIFGQHELLAGIGPRIHLPLDKIIRWTAIIRLHPDFYITAKRLSSLKENADPAMVMRFHFFFAVNLIHEVCHFLEGSHTAPCPEAYMNDNIWTEAGAAWEKKTFGGRVIPINNRLDCAYGVNTYDITSAGYGHKEDTVLYSVSMDYISSLLQQKTWEGALNNSEPCASALHIPRDGAQSLGYMGINLNMVEVADEASDVPMLEAPTPERLRLKYKKHSKRDEGRWAPY